MDLRPNPYPDPDIRPFRGLAVPPPPDFPFGREVAGATALLQFGRNYLSERVFPIIILTDKVVIAEHVRVASTFEAVIALALDGYGVQAELLTRPMYESFLTAWWAHTHSDETQERYDLHTRFLRQLHAQASDAEMDSDEDLTELELERAKKLFGKYGQFSWTGQRLATIATEHADAQRNLTLRDGFQRFYDFHHRAINWSMHSTDIGSTRHIDRYDEQIATYVIGPSDNGISGALYLATAHYSNISELVIEHFELGCRAEYMKADWKAMTAFNPDLGNTGRNESCPCSSGRKFKNCHGR